MIVLWCFLGILVFFIVCTFAVSVLIYKKIFDRRYNGNSKLKYFTCEDFPGLQAEPISFQSNRGQILKGYLYSAASMSTYKGLLIFSHGFGAGHQAYTTEINFFAKNGYLVLAYDGTGCVHSEGKKLNGFDQGVVDLEYCLRYIQSDEKLRCLKRVYVGHSWGAFTVANFFVNDSEGLGAVAMCGFVSSGKIIAQNTISKFKFLIPVFSLFFLFFNLLRFGSAANHDLLKSLKRSTKPIYLLYGMQDKIVPYRWNGAKVNQAFKSCSNVTIKICPKKGHNVYLTEEAETYMNTTMAEIRKCKKENARQLDELYKKIDYKKMTEEDSDIMFSVLNFLDGLVC